MSFLIYWAFGYVAGRYDAEREQMDSATRMRSNGGKARKVSLTKTERSAIASKGGKARAAGMSDAARSKAARRAVKIRWARVRAACTAAALKQAKRKRGRAGVQPRLS